MKAGQPFPYQVLSIPDGGQRRQVARIQCIRCDVHEDWTIGGSHNPERACKAFRASGWECDWSHPTRTVCPACVAKRGAGRGGDRVEDKVVTLQQPKAMTMAETTGDQRLRIRALLDKHFDDAKGFFLDGYSDQRIGAEVNVPWATVQKIREAAYGPIKGDPELEAIKAAVGTMERDLATIKDRVAAVEKRFRSAA